ncbi:hypothetical protein EV383_0291 [Pseudonocardia sediminis]|uniref:Pecanex-like protein 1 n=1 Tax=Pseudonocardia sediminis TaxID=1397368 RepID=A0A4Q7UPP3_PSEST|nr:Pecanex-like protein 1 [Pseudonocardia sediminis]RZT83486.1 hypothetical protein EV383_0291 [Pseudonocardia sediminis]
MAPTSRSRRRLFVAASVSAAVFVLGPAAYGVAATTVDGPAASSATQQESPDRDDGAEPDGAEPDGAEPDGAEPDGAEPDGGGADAGSGGGHDHGGGTSGASGSSGDGGSDDGGSDDGGAGDGGPGDGSAGQERMKAQEGVDGSGGKGDADGKDEGAPGLDVLATDCSSSNLAPHDGFQKAPRCVATAFGEVAAQASSPSLLITGAPKSVAKGQTFQIEVSTRNLVRDRFLGAAAGGYYKEASLLTADGLQRGHFHTACRMLPSTGEAPDASPEPAFFKATEDKKGGSTPDTVTVEVPGVDTTGELQCSAWAGDGSHRVPMMQRADQTPAFDSVRIDVG